MERTDAVVVDFAFTMFARGSATLPAAGMGAIPVQLASRPDDGVVRTGATVAGLGDGAVVLEDGEEVGGDAVVVAVDRLLQPGCSRSSARPLPARLRACTSPPRSRRSPGRCWCSTAAVVVPSTTCASPTGLRSGTPRRAGRWSR